MTESLVLEQGPVCFDRGSGEGAKTSRGPVTRAALRQWLITNIAAVLEIEPASIDPTRNLDELGLDSLQSVCLAGDLEAWLGAEIPATAIWDYPTIDCLSEYLMSTVA
jgi:acyl carrier protein